MARMPRGGARQLLAPQAVPAAGVGVLRNFVGLQLPTKTQMPDKPRRTQSLQPAVSWRDASFISIKRRHSTHVAAGLDTLPAAPMFFAHDWWSSSVVSAQMAAAAACGQGLKALAALPADPKGWLI